MNVIQKKRNILILSPVVDILPDTRRGASSTLAPTVTVSGTVDPVGAQATGQSRSLSRTLR